MAKIKLPSGQIHWLVDKMHCGAKDDAVRKMVRNRCKGTQWTEALIKRAETIGVRRHHANRKLFVFATGSI
ncbi:MAG: hypothetical protein H8E94_02415 [Alphaproteobacteria bacterium]|nr:hypothetical protein [Alphaproteobacteria bacterium]